MQSVLTALRVLETVSENQPIGVSDVARLLGIPKSSAQRALVTLKTAGWIQKAENDQDTRWVITSRALTVGNRAGGDVVGVARPAMERLHVETRETIHFLVREGNDLVLVEHLESPQVLRSSYPLGTRMPMTATSSGKAFLAALSHADAESIIGEELRAFSPATIMKPHRLWAQLDEIRALGYATNVGEFSSDIRAVGAAVLDAGAHPIAAISISVPAQRMNEQHWHQYGIMVADAARSISSEIGYRSNP